MHLRILCATQYFPRNPRIRDKRTIEHYERTLNRFRDVLGHEPEERDLTDDNVLSLMTADVRAGLSPVTANFRRKYLVALWNWCAKRRLVDKFPTVPKFPEPVRIPSAWSEEQLRRLIVSCEKAKGMIGDVLAKDWLLAFHAVAWDAGVRTTELLSLRWDWLDSKRGVLRVPAEVRKGKLKDALYQLMPDTIAALEQIRTRRKVIFDGVSRSGFWKRYNTVLRRAGLPTDKSCKPQKLRRSHASHLKAAGGDATASLMHSSDEITRIAYLDPSVCDQPHAAKLFRILPDPRNREPDRRQG